MDKGNHLFSEFEILIKVIVWVSLLSTGMHPLAFVHAWPPVLGKGDLDFEMPSMHPWDMEQERKAVLLERGDM